MRYTRSISIGLLTLKSHALWLVQPLLACWLLLTPIHAHALPEGFQVSTVIKGLTESVYLAQLPDGRMLVGTKPGVILIFDPHQSSPVPATYLEINDIDTMGERGLTSIAIDPQFESNGFVYVYYTHGSSQRNRISRYSHVEDHADPASETLIWQDNEAVQECCHYGGGIGFGPDGKLYLATGEEFDGAQAQDLTRAGGKVIRLNPDGSVPPDNPFVDGPGGNLDEIWAYGLRNPYRLHWDHPTNRLYIGEVGGNNNETAYEDIHLGRAGANYGWPYCEGECADPQFDDPVFTYAHPPTQGSAVTLGAIYRGSQLPSSYTGALFFADYVQQWLRYLELNPDGSVSDVKTLGDFIGRTVHLITGQDGAIYFVDIRGLVKRISYTAGNQPPVIESLLYESLPGPAPVTVDFDVAASDPEGDALTYTWLPGDGSRVPGKAISHEYLANGVYQVRVEVSDGLQTTTSDPVEIQVGNPPTATIAHPLNGSSFVAGDLIPFEGTGSDPDEPLLETNYSWDIRFGHNTHIHPTLTGYVGSAGSLEINASGHDYHGDTRYELELTVTDSDGLTATDLVTVYPEKADLQLSTSPVNVPVLLDTVAMATPITYDTLIGFKHGVSVAPQCVEGIRYTFESWSDGGAQTHEVTIPESGLALTAYLTASGTCSAIPASGLVLHLEADSGVTTTGTAVQGWADQSGLGNDLTGAGDPQLLTDALNGRPVIDFDGAGDKLERTTTLNGFPAGNGNRTVYLVANYESGGYGGFSFGSSACNQTFGTIVNPSGYLMVQGWCTASDFPSANLGTGTGWLIQSAVLQGSQLSHYRDGELIDSRSNSYNTTLSRLVLGAEIDSNPYLDMQVAVILVYDRALTAAEQTDVLAYLQQKYFSEVAENQAPAAANDSANLMSGGSVVIDVLANDSDPDGTLNPASVTVTQQPAVGVVSVEPSSGAVTYSHTGSSAATDTFSYQVADEEGAASNVATVSLTISTDDNQMPLAGDDTTAVVQGSSVLIDVLANDTDPEGELDPASVTVMTGPVFGLASVDPGTGEVVYQHSGTSTEPDSFQYRVSDLSGLMSEMATVTVQVTVPDAGVSISSPMPGDLVQGPSVTVEYSVSGSDYDHLDLSLDGASHEVATDLTGSYTYLDVPPGQHSVTATLVDDGHAPVPVAGATDSVTFLVTDEIGSPLALDDQAGVIRGQVSRLNILGNDVDIDGTVDPTSIYITELPQYGSILVDSVTGAVDYSHDGESAATDSFRYQVLDNSGLVSNEATVALSISDAMPASGLVLHLEADSGVATAGTTVQGWADRSGLGNDLMAAGDPQLLAGALNGQSVIDFDGAGDKLERTGTLNGFPAGNGNRTVYLVANYRGFGYGGFGFGQNSCNQMFGTSVNPSGYLVVQGWCTATDFHSPILGTGTGWLIQSAVLENSLLSHYRDGELIDSRSNSYNTTLTRLVLGAELDSNPYLDMQVAAVLVYDRALTASEQAEVLAYLQQKYFDSTAANQAPLAADDSASLVSGGDAIIELLQNDSDPDGTLDPASVTIVQPALNGSVEIDTVTGAVLYSHHGTGATDSFQYRFADDQGALSNAATVMITVTDASNQAPIVGDDTAAVIQGDSTRIAVLANDSDPEGELDPASVAIVAAPASGVASVDTATGEVIYQHGGASTQADSFQYQVSDLSGLASGAATVTVQVAAPDAGVSLTSPAPGEVVQGPSVTLNYSLSGSDYDHLELALDDQGHTTVTDPSGSYTFFDVPPGEHSVTATLVDDSHTPVPVTGATARVAFLVTDEIGSPLAIDDQAGVGRGQMSRLNVLANDVDGDGALDPTSVFVTDLPLYGDVLVDSVTGTIDYTHDGGSATADSFLYQMLDDSGLVSNEATVTLSISEAIPSSGLVLHLEADSGVTTVGTTVQGWSDRSGLGNDLTAAGDPQLLAGALNGRPVIDFDGAGDKLERTAILNGFPVGNGDRTVYLVASYESAGYGGFGFGHNSCNQMFGTIVNPNGYLVVQGWCTATDFHSATLGTGTGWLIQSAVLQGSQLSHYRGGELIDARSNSYNTTLTRLVLGAEIDSNPYLDMQVAAVLVYDRALSVAEHEEVLVYLQQKYGLN